METRKVAKRRRVSVIAVTPEILETLRLPLAVIQSILDVKFQFSIFVEDECAASGKAYFLIVGHSLRHGDVELFLFLQFHRLQFEDLHVLGDGLTKRKAVRADTQTWSNREHAAVCILKELEHSTVVPDKAKHLVWISLQRFEVNTLIADVAFGTQPNSGIARSACRPRFDAVTDKALSECFSELVFRIVRIDFTV